MQPSVKQVLIVEDDAAIRTMLEDLLRDGGYDVASASTGSDALAQMRQHRPDLVLLDLMLPDMDGWTFLRVRERERSLVSVPVLVISAAGPGGLGQAQALGAPIFLAKPFDLGQLLAAIERLLAGPVRQCAWCGRVMDAAGDFRLRSGRKLRWATHGICPTCKEAQRQELLN